jgi:hypothetical protein
MKEIVMSKSCVIDNERLELVLDDLNVFSIEDLKWLKRMIMDNYGGKKEVGKLDEDRLMNGYMILEGNISRRIYESWKYGKDEGREIDKRYREEDKENVKDVEEKLNGLYNIDMELWNGKRKRIEGR